MAIGLYTALQQDLINVSGLTPDRVNRGRWITREGYPLPPYPNIMIDDFAEDDLIETSMLSQPSVATRVRFMSQNDDEAYSLALLVKDALDKSCSEPFANFAITGLNATVHGDGVFEYSHLYTLTLKE